VTVSNDDVGLIQHHIVYSLVYTSVGPCTQVGSVFDASAAGPAALRHLLPWITDIRSMQQSGTGSTPSHNGTIYQLWYITDDLSVACTVDALLQQHHGRDVGAHHGGTCL